MSTGTKIARRTARSASSDGLQVAVRIEVTREVTGRVQQTTRLRFEITDADGFAATFATKVPSAHDDARTRQAVAIAALRDHTGDAFDAGSMDRALELRAADGVADTVATLVAEALAEFAVAASAAPIRTVWLVDYVAGGVLEAIVLRQRHGIAVIQFAAGSRLAGVRDEVDPGDLYTDRAAAEQHADETAAATASAAPAA